ncbi:Tc toxin subunit A-related protein [Wolbachia endosymbiont (group B) of Melanostoma mellinum]|uniref:Tc toxin subunit A-related protein n=1 Tax=Wolbachia endosymbiont (group B) of Melanostoma mellinum TaxID=2954030 RepID=UPI0022313A57|nr:neuraminidase-like domain-containing protein [Wolbachia endosymbiont (group B) of Melanostoma mellinum]
MTTDSNMVETIFKTKEGYNECDHCQSVLSPAAYFVKLVETIEKYIPGHKLKERRPDLFELPLDCNSTNKTKLYLEIANEIMEKNLDKKLGGNALQKLATAKYPFNLPANFPLISIRAYLEKQGITLTDLYKTLKPDADNVAESLSLSPEEYNLIIDATTTDSHLNEVYGIDKSELREAEKFIAQTNIDYNKLDQLIDCYNRIDPTNKLIINSGTIDNIDQALEFLHRFIRLANKLNWSFDELCNLLLAIDKNEVDAGALNEISRIKSLQEKLKKPLSEVCKLYSNASISIEGSKSEEDANNAAESLFFLQGVKESDLKKIYGIEESSEPFKEENFDEFIARTGAKRQEVERLLSQSTTHGKKAKKQEKISVKEQKFLHNFYQLTERFKLLFKKLGELTQALPKDLVTNIDNSTILQKIWNISKEELTSLINYNDKVSSKIGKSLILEVNKQILLARLMNISIAEVIQILLQLNISELTINNVEHVIELSDWLSNNSITIEQLSTLVNSSALSHKYTEQVSKICEELERDPKLKRDEKAFHNLVLQYIGEQLNEEGLAATHEFTKKQPTNLQLLRLESLDKSIVHDVGIIGQKAVFLGESKVLKKDLVEHAISEPRENVAVATVGAKTIFFGGKKSTNEYSKKIDIYDEDTGRWSTKVASEARDSAAVAVVDNKKAIFLGGNKNDRECSSKIDTYDVVSGEWKENVPNASEARSNASVGVIGDKAIFFGGEIGQERSSKIDIYENGNWTTHIASEARSNASVAIVDTKVIFFGGNKGGNQPSAKIDIYDAADIDIYRTDPMKRWTTYTVGEARENASVAIVDGKAIFFGGKADQTKSNKIDIYDAKTEKWLAADYTASEARDTVSVTIVGKQAVFFGGCKGNQQYSKHIDVYDSPTNSWKKTDEINEAHESVSAIVIGAKAIFFTGKKSTGQVYIYDSTSYSKDEDIAKSWIKRTAKETGMQDDLLLNIANSTKYSGKIDIYDDTAKSWRAIDLYKPDKCKSIRIHNNIATLTYQGTESSAYDRTYTVGLSITYDATIEELLNNATVFTMLKMDAEDITNHASAYKLKATWTEEQIKTLANYKALQNEFSGNELTLSQYAEWLRDSYNESKVTEKIAQLTNWDKKILNEMNEIDAFKKYFSKEHSPLDSLLKIKSFIDMSEQAAIDGKILLELKNLHSLSASTGWNTYDSAAKKLQSSLSFVEGVKEYLEDQKRNILANYMIHGRNSTGNKMYTGIENMRNLYSFLLIDVEMSDCSKISPLKAGLNSLQLYIHRCILGLEERATVSQELTEEMWDLLDNYREWEATKKIALYPENYLDPTLRKSATTEYKALQNTLMQGNLTDEEAANAYIKYFEDLSQLVSLKIVDTYYLVDEKAEGDEDKKKVGSESQNEGGKLYILGRTIAEPYTYYYRIGNFQSGTEESPQKWGPWEKIEVQIPVSIARVIHAFGKIFVFWLQKTEKEKQIDDVSIDDSTLSVNFAFKKVDNSWSAQQKLPYSIARNYEYEEKIRGHLESISLHTQHIAGRSENDTDNNYCRDEITKEKALIKNEVKRVKGIKFYGKLKVTFKNEGLSITSMENGFDNLKFTLNNNFHLTNISEHTWAEEEYELNKASNLSSALASVESLYQEKKEKYDKDILDKKEQLKAKESDISKSKKTRSTLQGDLNSKEVEKQSLQNGIKPVEKIDDLEPEVKNVEKSLDELPQDLQDNLERVSVEQGRIQEAVNNLEKRLNNSKQKVEEQLAAQLKIVTTEEGTLKSSIERLTGEIESLKSSKTGVTDQTQINTLDAQISAKEKEKEEYENQKRSLTVLKQFNSLGQKATVDAKVEELKKEVSGFENELKQDGIDQAKKDELNAKIKSRGDRIKEFNNRELFLKAQQKFTKLAADIITIKNKIKTLADIKDKKDKVDELDKRIKTEDIEIERLKGEEKDLKDEIKNLEDRKEKHFEELNEQEKQDRAEAKKLFIYEKSISNTVIDFIDELYTKAYIERSGAILAPEVQNQMLDFKGFYGIYLWEIFFHIPTLIAYLFNQEQKFAEARKWYQYIFNPLKKGCDAWQFIPFKTKRDEKQDNNNKKCDSGKLVDSLDSYKEADKKKTSHEKYIIISYVDNLIDWGDFEFSKGTWESINKATMLYIRAWDLLGERPKRKGKFKVKSKDICELSNDKYDICKIEASAPKNIVQNTQNRPSAAVIDLTTYCGYFCTPENKKFTNLWNTIEDRLYKIRHCLDIKGKRLELPLFQPSIDPGQLISAAAGGSTIRLSKIAQVPHYRFKYMITYAKSIADTVTQIGSELLSVLEKKDAEALTLLYNKQEGIMAKLMMIMKEKAIEGLKEEAKALNASLSSARNRKSHYEKLIEKGWSALEISSMATSVASTITLTAAGIARQVAAPIHLIPTIFGFSCGGFQPGSSADSIARGLEIFSSVAGALSQNLSTSASYERRAEDWDLQKTMATYDTEQISYQIEANKINQANAVQDLKAHEESIKQIREKEQFFRSKFTNQELYSWMKGELKSLYIRVYRLALEIARQAEWAYQYEIDNDKTFIQPGHWNSLKEGLLSGQKLKFDLEQLDKEYHDTNERRLEINKVISLKHLDPIALYELKTKGKCKFSLTEKIFDLDFPGHYARKIKDIKITIPAVVGPYENVHASLQQTSNHIILKSEGAINAIKYLLNPGEEEQPENDLLRANWKPNQEIAISRSDQDSGLFELSFGDERYLPFEGTGTVSTWELSLPQATNRFDISTISDVIIHLDYTALNGGRTLSKQVKDLNQIKYYQGTLVVNLSSVYPEEWEKFKQQAKGRSSELKFKLSSEIFPVHVKNPSVDLDGKNNICVIPTTPDMSRITIKINNYNWERNSKKIVNPSLTIGSDWSIKINNADISKIEEIMIMVPYKATINW